MSRSAESLDLSEVYRVLALQRHFSQSESDLRDIAVSTEKIVRRAGSIEAVELTPAVTPPQLSTDNA